MPDKNMDTPEARARAAFDAYRHRMGAEAAHPAPHPAPRGPAAPPWGLSFGPAAAQPPQMGAPAPGAPGSTIKNLGTLLGLSVELVNALLQGGTQLLYGMAGQGPGPGSGPGGPPHGGCDPCGHCLYRDCGCGCHPGVHGCR